MRSSPLEADLLQPSWLGFAHRGLHGPGVPENSLAAFRAAIVFTSGAECDVRLSSDGVPIVIHDADLSRLCDVDAQIDACDAEWLTGQLLIGTNETIPTLAELLSMWPRYLPLLVECKTMGNNGAELARRVASTLKARPRNAGIMSFDPTISRGLSDHAPNLIRGLVVNADWPADFRSAAVEQALPQFLAVDVRLLGDPWTASMREKMPVYSWTIKTAEQRVQATVHADALIWEGDGRPGN